MDATMRGPDGSGKCDLFLSSSPSVNYRKHPSEVHARAAYRANNYTGGQDSALTYPPKLQKRHIFSLYNPLYPECRFRKNHNKSSVFQSNKNFHPDTDVPDLTMLFCTCKCICVLRAQRIFLSGALTVASTITNPSGIPINTANDISSVVLFSTIIHGYSSGFSPAKMSLS